MLDSKQQSRLALAVCIGAAVACLASFWLLCARSPKISFLSEHSSADWIIYPKPPEVETHTVAELSAEFRRSFVLAQPPSGATLAVRAFKRCELSINGHPVAMNPPSNWKSAVELNVTGVFQRGSNEISVTVFNDKGPPALWLSLNVGSFHAGTGADWDASLAGAAWRKAWPANKPVEFAKGHFSYGSEITIDSFLKKWPMQLLFIAVSTVLVIAGSRFINRVRQEPGGFFGSSRFAISALLLICALWLGLFANNLGLLPATVGFDVRAHLDYIDYIRTHHALPLATDGWEMCQPPLYYLISALVLSPLHSSTYNDLATKILRSMGLLIGIANFLFVFLSTRLLFPKQAAGQFFCLLLAAFLPEQLYLSQYVTNEFLAATLVTAALYFCLRLLKDDTGSLKLSAAVGLCLGAALSTKATAIVAAPFILGTVACWPLLKRPNDARSWFRTLGIATAVTLIIGGGHYFRTWKHYGTPLVHDWDAASGFAWWADSGFHTSSSIFGFGESLARPFYSSFHGFPEGIYSTMWGDGFYGGQGATESRPPWNYDLMSAGYLLALVPALVIVVGLVVCLARFIRRPEPAWLLLLGMASATFAALLYMNLKLPFSCNAKAFYALTTLLPMCAVGAVGWEALWQRARPFRPVLCVLLGVWALNAFSSFWIRRDASTYSIVGFHLAIAGRVPEAADELALANRLDPHNLFAREELAWVAMAAQHPAEARQRAEALLAENPDDPKVCLLLAEVLANQNQLEPACRYARHAVELAPDLIDGYKKLGSWFYQLGKNEEAAAAAREALRLKPMDPNLHYLAASALTVLGDHQGAARYFRFACTFSPRWAIAHDQLGSSLAALRQWPAASEQFAEACRLDPREPNFQLHLAAANAQLGLFDAAITNAARATELSQAAGDTKTAAAARDLTELYRQHRTPPNPAPADAGPK